MKHIVSDVPALLAVHEDLFVQGAMHGGTAVDPMRALQVMGRVEGSVTVAAAGLLVVGGVFTGFLDRNTGTLAVAGVLATPMEILPGRVLVASGSLVCIDGAGWQVHDDGSTSAPLPEEDREPVSLGGAAVLRWDAGAARFRPTDAAPFSTLSDLVRRATDGWWPPED